jgi:protein ImuA
LPASSLQAAFARAALRGFLPEEVSPEDRLSFGISGQDGALRGGLTLGRLHELGAARPLDMGAATGFALALAGRVRKPGDILWIQQDFAHSEGGALYGFGTAYFGLAPARLLMVRVARSADVLWAMEEGLRCSGIAAIVGEMADDRSVDLTATRRLSLAAQKGKALGLILRPRAPLNPSAADTRWEISGAPSLADDFGGLGRTGFVLRLTKNKSGPLGQWVVEWNPDDKRFRTAAHLGAVAAPAFDRPHRARAAV